MAKPKKEAVAAKRESKSSSDATSTLHPPYFEMISDSISTLKDRTGSSQQAIAKFIQAKYEGALPPNFLKMLSVQLKKFVKSERLVKVKNSFKISSTEKLKSVVKVSESSLNKKSATTKTSPAPKETNNAAEKIADRAGLKTKRLSQVKTPEVLKKANKGGLEKKPLATGKTKRLSQVKTPEGLKKKTKNSTPSKRKISTTAKPEGPSRPTKKAKK